MGKVKQWLLNRVLLGLFLFFATVGMWEFKWKPQYRPLYQQGVSEYQHGDYQKALASMSRAYEIAPNSVDVIMMMGWASFKLKHYEEARFFFDRVLRIDPRVSEAQVGASFVSLETGRGEIDEEILNRLLANRGHDPNVRMLVAGALERKGKNLDAAAMYKTLLRDKNYGHVSQLALNNLFGLEGFNDPVPGGLAPLEKPGQTQVRYRAGEGALWRQGNNGWEKFHVSGINLGPAAPGYYPGDPPRNGQIYATWLQQIADMNANVVRAYTLLPPSFYRAFAHHVKAGGRLTLFQQIWVGDPPNKDLYDPNFVAETKDEIRYVVDALHGRGDVPPKRARGSGLYDNDISAYAGAILLGREVEPSVVIQTNVINGGKTSYSGPYFSISGATASEVWFAEMLDYLVQYEANTCNWQHPVAIVNWPPLDPLTHPTETPNLEEVKLRIRHGEKLSIPKGVEDDNDVVSIDEAKYKVSGNFGAGFFASYHVYPYWPDFLLTDPKYLNAHDEQGPNPMYGYLRDLRERIPYPLVIAEFGIPTSIGIAHFQPYGWHHGGQTEDAQARVLTQLGRSIRQAGAAGGIIFEWNDEWYKHNWLTRDFETPEERSALWINELDPEKRYGLLGYRTSKWKLFADANAWGGEQTLYSASNPRPGAPGGNIRSVQAATDEAFLYLKIAVDCLDCGRKKGEPDFEHNAYAVAINTLPSRAGVQRLPFGDTKVNGGANFLLFLSRPEASRLFISENYNPYQIVSRWGIPSETELNYKRSFAPSLQERGNFVEQVVETNRRRFGRDGTLFPAQRYSRSVLRYGDGNPASRDFDSLTEWFADVRNNAILVRIPWGKLFFTDPSSRRVFAGIDQALKVNTTISEGVDISVYQLKPTKGSDKLSAMAVMSAFPQTEDIKPERVTWKQWDSVKPEPYLKKSYYAIQKEYENRTPRTSVNRNRVPARVRRVAGHLGAGR